jgi:hypothetical protein
VSPDSWPGGRPVSRLESSINNGMILPIPPILPTTGSHLCKSGSLLASLLSVPRFYNSDFFVVDDINSFPILIVGMGESDSG